MAFKVMDYPAGGAGPSASGGFAPLPAGSEVKVKLVEIEMTPIKGRNSPESRIIGQEAVDFLRDTYQEKHNEGDTAYNIYVEVHVVEPSSIEGQRAAGHRIKTWYSYIHRYPSKMRGGRGAVAAMLRSMGFYGELERFTPPYTDQLIGLVGTCVTGISEGSDGYPDRTSVAQWVDKPASEAPAPAPAAPAADYDDDDVPF